MTVVSPSAEEALIAGSPVRKVVTSEAVAAASTTLTRAFFEDPVFEWVFPNRDRRRRVLPDLFPLYVQAYARHGETYITEDAAGTALWLPAGKQLVSEEEEAPFGAELEIRAGADAGRLFELMELFDEHHPEGTYWTLQLLAVDPESQGQGIGSRLIEPVLARCDLEQAPAYLEATTYRSVSFYERHGFRTIGEIRVPDGPTLYPMWREPR